MKTILRIWIVASVVLCAMMPARIEYTGKVPSGITPALSTPAWADSYSFTEIALLHTLATALALIAPAGALLIFWDRICHWIVRWRNWLLAFIGVAVLAIAALTITAFLQARHRRAAPVGSSSLPPGFQLVDEWGGVAVDPSTPPALPTHNAAGQALIWLDTSDPRVLVPVWPATANQTRRALPVASGHK